MADEFSDKENEMRARLANWGRAMGGGIPGTPPPDEERPDPDTLDADVIETAMIQMRWYKHLHYRLIRYLYLGRVRSDVEASNIFRKSEKWIDRRHKEALRYLRRHCKTHRNDLQNAS